jgi:hypothetical protein
MMSERFADVDDDTGLLHFDGWRYPICGEILDPLIIHHRKIPPLALLKRAPRNMVRSAAT